MIDLEAVIRHFGPHVVDVLRTDAERVDSRAIGAMKSRLGSGQPAIDRVAEISSWLRIYNVFQGIDDPRRIAITKAVLCWGDSQEDEVHLETLDALVEAHERLMEKCRAAYGSPRNVTSLASKALWLRYPDVVSLFDRFVQRALWMISKMESDITSADHDKSEYRKFAYVWRTLYVRYASAIAAIDTKGYPYRVRVFDGILWDIGRPEYTLSIA